ncbi:TatD family hydrolase [Jatrophihabitans telluris]|uniref:TatD family hydrolase n=1 Tax=Jatrophihabitans telluris TaxID=2038343 RepID=A0ABY4R1I2_9ACTN|nr:TatD family hydrolase [Jatrophihabitans telluris]UQX89332.1 TatD family hydrolase [Jatrophihabitans telluris]
MAKSSSSADRDLPPPLPRRLDATVFDAHCHVDAMAHRAGVARRDQGAPREYLDTVLDQAGAVGVTRIVNVGCEVGEWASTMASLEHPDVFGAIAVHPTEVAGLTDAHYAELEELLQHPKIVAVGETGLDYYWDRTSPQDQQLHFRKHLELAKRVGKPVMIHDRDAHDDVLRILDEEGPPPAGVVFHAFSGDAAMARHCVAAGYVLSFPGVLTFGNAPGLREAAALTPLEQMLVETDAPFLTPHPYRGRPNAPYLIPHVIRQVAELKEVSESVVCATISGTGARIFGI